MIGRPWYREESFLNALQFFVTNGIPLPEALSQFAIPTGPKRKILSALRAGASFREALQGAGVSSRDAALLHLAGGGPAASSVLDLSREASRMSSAVQALLAQAFAYPNVVVMLTVFCWFLLAGLGIATTHLVWTTVFIASILVCFAIQVLVLLPWHKIPFLRGIRLLEDSRILFTHLQCCIHRGLDERDSMRSALEDLGLGRAAGADAWDKLRDGEPLLSVLAQMPGVTELGIGIPPAERLAPLLGTLAQAAGDEWTGRTARLSVFLRAAGLLASGSALLALSIQVFLSVYGGSFE